MQPLRLLCHISRQLSKGKQQVASVRDDRFEDTFLHRGWLEVVWSQSYPPGELLVVWVLRQRQSWGRTSLRCLPPGHEPQELREVLGSRSTTGSSVMRPRVAASSQQKGRLRKQHPLEVRFVAIVLKNSGDSVLVCTLYSVFACFTLYLPNELYAQDFQTCKYITF